MERSTLFVILLAMPLALFWALMLLRLKRGQIYRADDLVRCELNRMHRHTIWTALLCASMLVVAAFLPSTRLYLGLSALIMLLGVLPLRTLFVELGVRYNRNGKPEDTFSKPNLENDG